MAEEADAAAVFAVRREEITRPVEACWPEWSGYIREAFEHLRDDRFYGAMGGLGHIYFAAIDGYARRRDIIGAEFDDFLIFLRALDDEFVSIQNERAKAEADKSKNGSP